MEALQERMLKEFAVLRENQSKLAVVDDICAKLASLDAKLTEQAARLDQVQVKVDLSCDTLGQVQQGQFHAARGDKATGQGERSSPTASEVSDGILGAGPRFRPPPPPPPLQVPVTLPLVQLPMPFAVEENSNKRQWMPKMDFPRFDGSDVRNLVG